MEKVPRKKCCFARSVKYLLTNFADELRIVKDGKHGTENPDVPGGWDGMVGELIRKVSSGNFIVSATSSIAERFFYLPQNRSTRKFTREDASRVIEHPASRKTIDRRATVVEVGYGEAVLSLDNEFEPAPLDAPSLQARQSWPDFKLHLART